MTTQAETATQTETGTQPETGTHEGGRQPETGVQLGDSLIARLIHRWGFNDERDFVLRVVQPALVGMIDGTVSSLAPIFTAAVASNSHTALLVGFSTAV